MLASRGSIGVCQAVCGSTMGVGQGSVLAVKDNIDEGGVSSEEAQPAG